MEIDKKRVQRFLYEIKKDSIEIEGVLKRYPIDSNIDPLIFKGVKYMLVEIAEAISNILQHILAQSKGVPVSGYIDTILKAKEHRVISEAIFQSLKPFFDFRNSLVHRYWIIEDKILLDNLRMGITDF
ncbi:MAG: HepT-like ribonuclease domain-containing protein [bacterium]